MSNPLKILLIEDDSDDVELFTHGLDRQGIPYDLETLYDGAAIIDYVERQTNNDLDLIVMDFNLPKMHGREVLSFIKKSHLKNVPLVILSTSSAQADIEYSENNGAARFITKPSSLREIESVTQTILSLAKN